MSKKKIIRAWKDPVYRNSLSENERAALPPNPAGAIEISDSDLGWVAGGELPNSSLCTVCPSTFTCTFTCPTYIPVCPIGKRL